MKLSLDSAPRSFGLPERPMEDANDGSEAVETPPTRELTAEEFKHRLEEMRDSIEATAEESEVAVAASAENAATFAELDMSDVADHPDYLSLMSLLNKRALEAHEESEEAIALRDEIDDQLKKINE